MNFKLCMFACRDPTADADPSHACSVPQDGITERKASTSGVKRKKIFLTNDLKENNNTESYL